MNGQTEKLELFSPILSYKNELNITLEYWLFVIDNCDKNVFESEIRAGHAVATTYM
jgi:hypothetical protein